MSTLSQVVVSATSTNMNSNYFQSNFMEQVTVVVDGTTVIVPEYFSSGYTDVVNALAPTRAVRYDGSSHITTIANTVYGNTSCWWMIMIASALMTGAVHPLFLDSGDVLLMPNVSNAVNNAAALNDNSSSRNVQVTSI